MNCVAGQTGLTTSTRCCGVTFCPRETDLRTVPAEALDFPFSGAVGNWTRFTQLAELRATGKALDQAVGCDGPYGGSRAAARWRGIGQT